MGLRRKASVAAVLAAVFGVSTVAIASDDGRPVTDRVAASITFEHATIQERQCDGQEGLYFEQRVAVTGTAVGDPRLTGSVTVRLRLLIEASTGDGYERGTFVLRDPDTQARKARASFDNADIDEISQGTLVGKLRDPAASDAKDDDEGGFDLLANWRITFHQNGAVTAQIGGEASDGRLPALIVSGRCTGPFETFEADIPPPDAITAAANRAGPHGSGWRPGS